jgi:hypothetical protein
MQKESEGMILNRAITTGMVSRGGMISALAFIIGFSALLQAQDVVIHVPFTQPRLLEVDAGQDRRAEDPGGIMLGEDMEVKGGTPEYSYTWTDPVNQVHHAETLSATSFGRYFLTVTDQRQCTATDSVSIFNATAVDEDRTAGTIAFYPNPTRGAVHFDGSGLGGIIRAEVIDNSGKTVLQELIQNHGGSGTLTLHLGSLPKGIYLIRLSGSSAGRIGHIQVN